MSSDMNKKELEDRVVQLEAELAKLEREKTVLSDSEEKYRQLVETLDETFYRMALPSGDYEYVSPSAQQVFGHSAEEMMANPLLIRDMIHPDFHEYFKGKWVELLEGTVPPTYQYKVVARDGAEKWIVQSNKGIIDDAGAIVGIEGLCRDVTADVQARERLQRQADEILELSTPVIQVWRGIVVVPLIGSLDSQRTQHFMEHFLGRLEETASSAAIVDITGVPTIDTQTAQHLIEAVAAARLLGVRVILTGIKPAIAQTLVHLGVDLVDIDTMSSLSAGLQLALRLSGMEISALSG